LYISHVTDKIGVLTQGLYNKKLPVPVIAGWGILKTVRKDSNMDNQHNCNIAVFYCRNVPESDENTRIKLEKKYGKSIRFFPVVCSGRMDILHLIKALESYADAAFIITCPEGTCRYFEGNIRAIKRVEKARKIIESIGLEKERIGIIVGSKEEPKTLEAQVKTIVDQTAKLSPSPVHMLRQNVVNG
jgi:F420-non-reducing hydrogenase iron-sulfur subunit